MVDITKGNNNGLLVAEHGAFGPMGFMPNTGKLKWVNGSTALELATGLNLPAGLVKANDHTWYITTIGDGSVLKVCY